LLLTRICNVFRYSLRISYVLRISVFVTYSYL